MPFYIGVDGHSLYDKYFQSGKDWHSPAHNHGGNWLYEPVSIRRSGQNTSVFVVGTDHSLHHKHWNGSEWSDFASINGQLIGPPAVSHRGNGTIDVFYVGSD